MTHSSTAFIDRFYPIGDIVDPLDKTAVKELSTTIVLMTNGPWVDDEGTGGVIIPSRNTKSLHIRANWQLHGEIVEALDTIRQAKEAGEAMNAIRVR
ncbi:MAG: hypothetical protein CMJ78_08710 [Planctomycetaceae bacterium]|nr:hypothetical protein [Planctomycetaceae bacterium]